MPETAVAPTDPYGAADRLSLLVDRLPVGVAYLDEQQRCVLCNRAFTGQFDLSPQQALGRSLRELLPEDAHAAVEAAVAGQPGRNTVAVERPGEAARWLDVQLVPDADSAGNVQGVIALIHEITERVRTEELHRDDDRLLRTVLDGTTDSIFVKDVAGRYLLVNAAGAQYIGRAPADVLGRTDAELFPPETARSIAVHDQLVLEGGALRNFDVLLPVGGMSRAFQSTKTPYRDAQGRIAGLIGISRDVTEEKRALEALRESEERLARILESAMDAIVTIDEHGSVCLFNTAAEDLFRCTTAEVLGRPFDRFAAPSLRTTLQRCQQAFAQSRLKKRYVWIPGGLSALRADGEEFPIEATISEVRTAGKQLLTMILRDVNERRRAEEELRKLQLENLYLQQEAKLRFNVDEMVGTAPALRKVFQSIEQVAGTDSTVLITGETGTGKELVARAIHTHSARQRGMLVKVNCAALPAGLVESELFGHEKGAFTGALTRKTGRFELANGGTIFLDEIGDLPLELQAKLLRVLQEGEFEHVGGTETLTVDVRVIAATHHDLQQEIAAGRFRSDLYYRLNVFPIHVPPLRERVEDIAALARHFALHYARRMGKRIESIPSATIDALLRYDWPGNVRELENVIERAVIISSGRTLELGEWPPTNWRAEPSSGAQKLADVEREHVLKVLTAAKWRVSGPNGAAAILGLRPTTLESRMKRLGIARQPGTGS